MSNVSSPRRWPRGVVGFVCAACLSGCLDGSRSIVGGPGGDRDDEHGVAVAAIMMVPGAVQCITLTLSRQAATAGPTDLTPERMDFPVTAGAPTTLSLGPQAAGTLRVTGAAYDEPCDGLEPATQPTWVGDPAVVTIQPGRRASIAVTLRRNVDQQATVDFLETPTALTAGSASTAAIFGDGRLRLWGRDVTRGDDALRPMEPPTTAGFAPGVTSVASGLNFLCVLDSMGIGCVSGGGDAPATRRYALPNAEEATSLHGSGDAVCAVARSSRVYCWGGNADGEVTGTASGPPTVAAPSLLSLGGGAARAVTLSLGARFGCLVNLRGGVQCWGANDEFQLGTRNPNVRQGSVAVNAVTQVAVGEAHACALIADGTVQCWGGNAFGQLGNATSRATEAPTQVAGLSGVTALAAGLYHTCALLQNGTVQCWGLNVGGQLGNGSAASSPRPVAALGLSGVVEVVAGTHTCARLRDHSIRCWGQNSNGQLGDGTLAHRFVPTQVAW